MKKWKILAHDDLDGVVSAVLLSILLKTNKVKFDIYDKKSKVDKNTIVTDLPYHKGCGLWFDHHISNKTNKKFKGKFVLEKSCARVIYNYYNKNFSEYYKDLVKKVDKADSGGYTTKDIKSYNKTYLIDRIGFLAPFKNKKEKKLFLRIMFDHFKNRKSFDDLFKIKRIKNFIEKIKMLDKKSIIFIKKKGIIKNKTLIIDSSIEKITLNPFFIYINYPKCKYILIISKNKNKIEILVTFNKFYKTKNVSNIGKILNKFGGYGHKFIGGCRIESKNKDRIINEILGKLK
ncbi:MAG: hypothetical protein AB1571_03000 [Nanoarchaeota archaeon]